MKKIFKKLLLLSVLFTLTLSANKPIEINHDDPNDPLMRIYHNGWNESNKTLNARIISWRKNTIPQILKLAQSPLGFIPPTTKDPYPRSKIRLTRDDYTLLFVYLRYLEHSGKQEEAYQNYLTVLKGLKKLDNYADHDFIVLVFRMVIENITVQALQAGIRHHAFDEAHKKKLQKLLPDLLLLDNKMLLDSILGAKNQNIQIFKDSFLKKEENKLVKAMLQAVYEYTSMYLEVDYKKTVYAIQTNTLKALKQEKENNTLETLCIKDATSATVNIMLLHFNTHFWQKCIGHLLLKVTEGKFINTYQEYLEKVEANKAFIKSLSEK